MINWILTDKFNPNATTLTVLVQNFKFYFEASFYLI